MRKIKNNNKKIKKTKRYYERNIKIDINKSIIRTVWAADILVDIIKWHRELWDEKNTYLKPWLKGVLTSSANHLKKFVDMFSNTNDEYNFSIVQSKKEKNKKIIEEMFQKSTEEKRILLLTNGKKNTNYNIFKSYSLLKIVLKTLETDLETISIYYRNAKKELCNVLKELSIYIKWWNKEVNI